ncbi:hypothetical protein [Marilutibacter chinensis]|uniref:Uncharacterized protein n=1 Tax=Marilutibacter chinensis TaxID=2912247 RepID=A0ABS9HTN8_9GAMM|nr:hypothetical protein [Lysobacter chinensis]MCF7222265.1 hypothetical protein [Lysobacter chinensis]
MARVKKSSTPPASRGPNTAGADHNVQKRIESERISADIADFEKSGGRIEKLGVTRVLQKIAPAAPDEHAVAPPGGRGRRGR